MSSNGFNQLKNDSWLLTAVIYSYFSFFMSLLNIVTAPYLSLFLQLVAIPIILYSKYKNQGTYQVLIWISLAANILLLLLVCGLILIQYL